MAIPPTTGPVYDPLPVSDGDQTLSSSCSKKGGAEDAAAQRGMVAARRDGEGQKNRVPLRRLRLRRWSSTGNLRAVRCVGKARWENAEWRPFSQLPDFPSGPAALKDDSTELSFANSRLSRSAHPSHRV